MHNLQKIKVFRILLYITYPISIIFLYPLALLKRKNDSNIFFFFDRYVIGGAQRIHLDILYALPDIHKEIYFTRYSPNDKFKKEFYSAPNTRCTDIHTWCDNLLIRLFTVHYFAFYLNRHKDAHIFSSNSTFFYDLLPFLKKRIRTTELLHNFTHGKNGMEHFGLANHKLLDDRIVYDAYTLSNIKKQYVQYNVDEQYLQKISFIEPGTIIPENIVKNHTLPLKILYAGRGGIQKRLHLLNKVAEALIKQNLPVEFHFAGPIEEELDDYVKDNSVYHGEISNPEKMFELYNTCHALLLTSGYEGFPMFIKEGMAHGCVPIVTALEGNKMHLTSYENSILIEQPENEAFVVEEGISKITELIKKPELFNRLSINAYRYASIHFAKQKFNDAYRAFFNIPS